MEIVMKNIALLGSTGSIGTQTLDIVRKNSDELNVSVLAAGSMMDKVSALLPLSPAMCIPADSIRGSILGINFDNKEKSAPQLSK